MEQLPIIKGKPDNGMNVNMKSVHVAFKTVQKLT